MSTQQRIYSYLQEYIVTHGYSPAMKEIVQAFDVAPNTIRYHLDMLEAIGKITRQKSAWITIPEQKLPQRVKGLPEGSWMPKRQKRRKRASGVDEYFDEH